MFADMSGVLMRLESELLKRRTQRVLCMNLI